MKILLTGSNSRQCGVARPNPNKIFDAENLCSMLKSFADVDFMPISRDVDFDAYDFVVSGFGAIGSFNYTDTLAALYAIGKVKQPIVYLEDWRCPNAVANGLKSTYNKGYDEFVKKVFNKTLSSGVKFYHNTEKIDPEIVWRGIEKTIKDSHSCKFIIPAFSWGNKDIVADILNTDHGNILWFDETPYAIEQQNIKDVPYDPNRTKRFFYCGLTNQDSWLKKNGIKDITDCFGHSPYPKIPSEAEVNMKHNEYLGIAIPEYNHAGSGWLRFRYIYGAMSKNVFFISKKDADALGIESIVDLNCDSRHIQDVAMATYEAIKKHIPTKEQANELLKDQFKKLI